MSTPKLPLDGGRPVPTSALFEMTWPELLCGEDESIAYGDEASLVAFRAEMRRRTVQQHRAGRSLGEGQVALCV